MRSISFILLFCSLAACKKWTEPKPSNQITITVENECYSKFTLYNSQDSSFVFSDYWDCRETKGLYYQLKAGQYFIKADNGFKTIYKTFTKTIYEQSLSIEFP